MRFLLISLLMLVGFSCKNKGESVEQGARQGAQNADALNARDTNFLKRSCYCEFLLDSVEREPFVMKESVSTSETENCRFSTGTDGSESHRLDTLNVEVYSGATSEDYDRIRNEFADEGWQELSGYYQKIEKGVERDKKIELRVGSKDDVFRKVVLAYDDFTGRLFSVSETSLKSTAQPEPKKIFDSLEVRYVDELFLNFQGACDSNIDL